MPREDCARLAHFSDIHIGVAGCRWRADDWMSKRLASWFNHHYLGRGHRFRHAEDILAALTADLKTRGFDHFVFSGDATALGFDEEMVRAVELLEIGKNALPPGLAVPGNHDYCTRRAQESGTFERLFASWQTGTRVDSAIYPFAQRVGPVWLVAVNSAAANRWPWDASGQVGAEQRQRLATLLGQLDDAPRVLVTHYPVLDRLGHAERSFRKLRDLDAVLDVTAKYKVNLWLHGHNHRPYHHPAAAPGPLSVVCAGSTTQDGRWSYGDYTLTADRLVGRQRVYDPVSRRFRDGEAFELDLTAPENSPVSK